MGDFIIQQDWLTCSALVSLVKTFLMCHMKVSTRSHFDCPTSQPFFLCMVLQFVPWMKFSSVSGLFRTEVKWDQGRNGKSSMLLLLSLWSLSLESMDGNSVFFNPELC